MKKAGLFGLLVFIFYGLTSAQQDSTIRIINGSFEDSPKCCDAPVGWIDCGYRTETPPDVQPALNTNGEPLFGVSTKPIFGKTYLGMVVRKNETYERVSQRLTKPMLKGKCYSFSIYLAKSNEYISGSNTDPKLEKYNKGVKLRIWGGEAYCNQKELLAESDTVGNTIWKKYDFEFHPKSDISYLELEAYYYTPSLFAYNGNLLLDNASHIVPIPCPGSKDYAKYIKEKTKANKEELKIVAKEIAKQNQPKATEPVAKPEKILKDLDNNVKVGQTIKIEKLFFDADSSTIKPESFQALDELYTFLKANPKVAIEIGGHTNNVPPAEYCNRLSENRAKSVSQYLLNKGIDASRISYKGYGKLNPITSNTTKEGRIKNQRVEIKILSII